MRNQSSFFQAVRWSYAANLGERGFSAVFTFFLAALLGPKEFGLATIASIYVMFVQMFLDQGLTTALIQRKDADARHFDAVFWTNMTLSLLLAGVSVVFSGWWAQAYHLPGLSTVIVVLSVDIPLEGLACVHAAILRRNMDFKGLSTRSNVSVVVGGAVGLILAYKGFGVWALVFQQLSRDAVAMVLLWGLSKWRPRFTFSFSHLKELLGFSVSHFLAQLATFADTQAAGLLIGVFFGPVAVGLYRLAARFQSTVLATATNSVQAVSLPEFSRLQAQCDDLRRSVLSCLWLSASINIPALAGLAAVSGPLMELIGPEWVPAGNVLKLLCISAAASSFVYFTGPLVQALGMPQYMAGLEWARACVGSVVLVIAGFALKNSDVTRQIFGIAMAGLVTNVIFVTPVYLGVLMRFSKLNLKAICSAVRPSLIAAGALTALEGSMATMQFPAGHGPLLRLIVDVAIGALVGTSILIALDPRLRALLKEFMKYVQTLPRLGERLPSQ